MSPWREMLANVEYYQMRSALHFVRGDMNGARLWLDIADQLARWARVL